MLTLQTSVSNRLIPEGCYNTVKAPVREAQKRVLTVFTALPDTPAAQDAFIRVNCEKGIAIIYGQPAYKLS